MLALVLDVLKYRVHRALLKTRLLVEMHNPVKVPRTTHFDGVLQRARLVLGSARRRVRRRDHKLLHWHGGELRQLHVVVGHHLNHKAVGRNVSVQHCVRGFNVSAHEQRIGAARDNSKVQHRILWEPRTRMRTRQLLMHQTWDYDVSEHVRGERENRHHRDPLDALQNKACRAPKPCYDPEQSGRACAVARSVQCCVLRSTVGVASADAEHQQRENKHTGEIDHNKMPNFCKRCAIPQACLGTQCIVGAPCACESSFAFETGL
mmetsp:Transcript_4608/g.12461  ORF Transcript_4608/g.12461 Transcript_4608/m.12461 type:complete len:263 (+) Transcript_4608:964-1752(+)